MATDATFAVSIDLSGNELRNARAHVLASAPAAAAGKFFYNSTTNTLQYHNGSGWVDAGVQVANLSGQASAFGQSAANGSASTAARSDHYHALPAHNAAAHSSIKLSDLAAPSANLAMGGYKLTGLAAGSANGDSVRYEQVIGQFLPIGGGTLTGDLTVNGELLVNGDSIILDAASGVMPIIRVDPSPTHNGFIMSGQNLHKFLLSVMDDTSAQQGYIQLNSTPEWVFYPGINMGGSKIKGLPAASANGEAVRYEQVVGVYQPLDGDLTAIAALATNGYARRTGSNAWTIDSSIPQTSVTSLTTDLAAKAPSNSPTLTGTPTAPTASAGTNTTQIATTAFVQAAVQASASGLDVKESVRVATTGNITLSGTQTIDTVSVVAGNRVLVKDQTTPSQNGIYVVAAGGWTRATDFDSTAEVTTGAFTFVEEGSANKNTGWVLSTTGTITVGTTGITFVKFSASSLSEGEGITIIGDTISVNYAEGLTTTLGVLKADRGYFNTFYAQKYSADLVDGMWSTTHYLVTHNLGTRDIQVSVREVAGSYGLVNVAVEAYSTTQCKVYFATKPTSGTYRVTVVG